MNELALFAGAGGGILGGTLLGWRTVCAVEFDPYAASVLIQRQDDGILPSFPIWDDVRTFDGNPWRGIIDVVSGGFPCQDISCAGKGAGLDGKKSGLWFEFERIIGEVRPRFAFVENSPMLTVRGIDDVLGGLASLGYNAEWGVLGADDAGAPHERKRIWIVAYTDNAGSSPEQVRSEQTRCSNSACSPGDMADTARFQPGRSEQRPERERVGQSGESSSLADPSVGRQSIGWSALRNTGYSDQCGQGMANTQSVGSGAGLCEIGSEQNWNQFADCGSNISEPDRTGCEEQRGTITNDSEYEAAQCGGWWLFEPDVGRVAHGVAARVDRLKAIGNGQVPAVAALAWRVLRRRIGPKKG